MSSADDVLKKYGLQTMAKEQTQTASGVLEKYGLQKFAQTAKNEQKAGTSVPASPKMLPTAKQTAQEDFWALKAASATEQALAAADILNGNVSETQKKKAAENTAAALKKYQESAAKPLPTANPINIRALGAGDYENTKADEAMNSAVYGTASSLAEIQRQLLAPTGELTIGQNAQTTVKGISQSAAEKEKSERQKVTQDKVGQLSDYLAQRSNEEQEKAKEGLSAGGKLMVDLGINGTQILGDAAMNLLLPGSGLASMATRVYGQSAGQARREGKNEWQQVLSGAKSSAIEVVTERMFDGLAGIYGEAEASNMVKALSRKLAKTDTGRTITRWLINSTGEGIEEIASDVLNPIADKVLGLSKGPLYTKADIPQMLYDGLVGAIMGGVGGAVNIATGEEANTNARLRTYDEAIKAAEGNFTTEGNTIKGLSEKGALRAAQNFSDNMEAQKARQGSFELLTGKQGAELPGRMDTQTGVLNNGRLMTAADMTNSESTAKEALAQQKTLKTEKSQGESNSLVKKLAQNIPTIKNQLPVTAVSKNVLQQTEGNTLSEKVNNLFSKVFGVYNREGFGDIEINRRSAKNDFGHGMGEAKAATIAAVPSVLKYGKQIEMIPNYKGRPYDSYVFAAPVTMDGETVFVGAIVTQTSKNKFYLHEVVDSKGNTIKMSNDSEPIKTSLAADSDAGAQESLLDNSILRTGEKSNTNMLPGNLQTLGELPRGAAESVTENAESVSKPAKSVTENAESGAEKISTRDEILKKHKEAFYEKVAELFPTVKNRTLSEAVDTLAAQIQQPTANINTIYQTFEKLWNESTMTVRADASYREAAQTLKGSRIYINDSIRADIGDNWRSVAAKAKRAGITFTRNINDRGVDVLNQSMSESYPGLFDASSTDGGNMVYNLLDIMDKSKAVTTDLPTGMENQYGKDFSGKAMTEQYKRLMKAISDTDRATKTDLQSRREAVQAKRENNTPEKQLELARQEMSKESPKTTTALDKVTGKYPIVTDVSYEGAASMVAREKAAYKTKKLVEKMEKDLNPTAQEKSFAKDMAAGLYTERDIPLTLNSKKIIRLADYYAANSSFKDNLLAQRARDNKSAREEVAERLVKDSTGYKPPKALSLNFNTMKRNIERSFGTEAPEIIKWVIDPIRENSKNKKLWQMDQRAGLDAFGLSSNESALVQQVIEGRAAQEEMTKLEPHEQKDIKAVIQNMNNGMTRAKANAEFNLNQTQLDLAEQYRKWQNTQASLKNADADKVTKAADWLTKQYGQIYDAINDFLTAHGYKPIGFIKGYAPHLQPEETMSGFAKALQRLGLETEVVELPTEIAGRTETFRPGKSWDPNFLSRNRGTYEDDAVAGWESYTDYISNVLYHTDDIQKLRTLSETLRSKYAKDEILEKISWAKNLRSLPLKDRIEAIRQEDSKLSINMTEDETNEAIDEYINGLFTDKEKTVMTKYGDFVSVLDDYTNKLALKQTKFDRSVESLVGRKALNWGNQLTKIFGESTIVGNLSSALNQTAQLPMLRTEVGGKYIREALKDIADGTLTAEEFDKQSAFLVGKMDLKSAEDSRAWKDKTFQQKKAKVMDVGAIPFEAVDDLASRLIVRAKYLEAIGNGKSTTEAVKIADEYADRLVGSREQGMKAMIFENKNAATKLFSTFQLEVANSWEHLSHDLRAEYKAVEASQGKNAAVKLMAGRLVKYLISAFLVNRLTDEIYGGTPAPFDVGGYILGSVAAGYGKSTNTYLATVIDNTLEKMGGNRIFGTKRNTSKNDLTKEFKEAGYLIGGDIPYAGNVGALLGWTDNNLPLPKLPSKTLSSAFGLLSSSWDEEKDPKEELEKVKENALKELPTWVPLGNQARKTISGVRMLAKGGEYSGGDLEYPIPSGAKGLLTGAQGLLFGSNATQAAQNYYAAGSKKLTDKATAAYQAAVKSGADRQTVYDAIQAVRSAKKTDTLTETQAKIKALQGADLSGEAKRAVYEGVISDKHSEDIDSVTGTMRRNKLSFDEYLKIQYKYLEINQKDLKASEKATEFSSWVNQQGYSITQQNAAKSAFAYYNSSVADATAYNKMTAAGMSDISAKRAADAVLNLPSGATEYERYRAAANALTFDDDKLKALSAMMTDSDGDDTTYQKLKTGYDYGVSPEVYLTVKEQIAGLESVNQKSVEAALDGLLGLDNDQKAVLWQLTVTGKSGWKGYKNPYNTAIGNTIYKAYN